MTNLHHLKLSVLAVLMGIIFLANSSNAPNGRTGAPGENTCAPSCHNTTNPPPDGNISINGLPAAIDGNTTYTITVTLENPNGLGVKGGFQWVALDDGNTDVGTLSNAGANTSITPSGGRTYHEHQPAQLFNGSNEVSYTVDWTAPAGPDNEIITFYGAGVIADGTNGNKMDRVVATSVSGTLIAAATPPSVTISLNNDVLCFGGNDGSATANATGGQAPYNFLWDNGETSMTAINLSAGNHMVTITDANMITASASIVISEPSILGLSIVTIQDAMCTDMSGTAEVIGTGGTGIYNYIWSNGQTGAIASGLVANNYQVTVTDGNLCEENISVTVGSMNNDLGISIVEESNPLCNGDTNGTIEIQGTNGAGNYSFQWSNGATSASNSNLAAGTYSVTVSDDINCQVIQTFTLTNPALLTTTTDATEVSCFGFADGTITTMPSGGTAPYTINWAHGMNTTDLPAGKYFVTILDANMCTAIDSIEIFQPQELQGTITPTPVNCFGENNGSLNLTAQGGVGPLTYFWSNGETSEDVSGLSSGFYSVTITDSTNCAITLVSLEVTQPDSLILTPEIVILPGCSGQNFGTITVAVTGGTEPFSYHWGGNNLMTDTINVLPGFYPVTITDANNCADSTFVNLTVTDTNPPIMNVTNFSIYVDEDGQTSMIDTSMFDLGSTDDCDLLGFTFDNSPLNCAQSSYELPIQLEDINENIAYDTVIVTVIDTFAPTIACVSDYSVIGCNDSNFTIPSATDNCGLESLIQTSGPAPGDMLIEGDNEIIFLATDLQGNTSECQFTISLSSTLGYSIETTNPSCFNFQDGTVIITPVNGVSPYTINFSPTGIDPNFLESGWYHFEIIDSSGCMVSDSFEIVDPPILFIDGDLTTITNSTNSNSMDGSIEITAVGGAPGYTYSWFFNGNPYSMEEDLDMLAPGVYTCTVMDSAGCLFNSIEYIVEATTGNDNTRLLNDLKVFPNPTSDILFIKQENTTDFIQSLDIISTTGKIVSSIKNPSIIQEINVSDFPKGLYFIKMNYGTQSVFKKVIIQ